MILSQLLNIFPFGESGQIVIKTADKRQTSKSVKNGFFLKRQIKCLIIYFKNIIKKLNINKNPIIPVSESNCKYILCGWALHEYSPEEYFSFLHSFLNFFIPAPNNGLSKKIFIAVVYCS